MDRRHFLHTGAVATAALAVLSSAPEAGAAQKKGVNVNPRGRARLKIGILSDVHVVDADGLVWLDKALRHFRGKDVDGVIISGDMSDWGTESQLRLVRGAWDKVFPSDRGIGGRKVERLFVTGNHDVLAPDVKYLKGKDIPLSEFFCLQKEEMWQRVFDEPYEPIWKKEVGGYTFIGAQYADGKTIPGLEEFLAGAGVKGDKPFFYIQHMHPAGTCSGPWVFGQDNGEVTRILSGYPNAVAISGHSHTSLTDDRTMWQGAFTSIGAASLSYILPFGGRENTKLCMSKEKVPSQMKVHKFFDGQHGSLMTVYDNCLVVDKMEFHNGDELGRWVVPVPFASPLSFECRAGYYAVPQFSKDASSAIRLSRAPGEDRYKNPEDQVSVFFPTVTGAPAESVDVPVRAFDYEVCVEMEDFDTVKTICTKRVLSVGYHLASARDLADVCCVFAVRELSSYRRWRFAIRPCNCYGVKGDPIYSPWQDPVV